MRPERFTLNRSVALMGEGQVTQTASRSGRIGRVLGPSLFVAALLVPDSAMEPAAARVAAVALWMAVWWVSEAAPLAVTSLLPLVLFPLIGVRGVRDVAPNYAGQMIFLFLGGFVLALAIERSQLHRRLALRTLHALGGSPRRLVWGFLTITAVLSMWLSNTATTLMLLPIAVAVSNRIEDPRSPTRILLALAFGASIGGIGTLVGTPPNLVLAGMAPSLVPGLPTVTFGGWMLLGVPLVLALLPLAGLFLSRGLPDLRVSGDELSRELLQLGRPRPMERRAAILFLLTATAWITRSGASFGSIRLPGWSALVADPKLVSDAVPAIAAAVLTTLIPAGEGQRRSLLTWDEIQHGVPWGILLLFGGGFALADGVHASGLDVWLAAHLQGLGQYPFPVVVFSVALLTAVITNLTSNTATATLLMPVMAALAEALQASPYMLMATSTIAASCAFVLPVATPPNAIVMGSGRVRAGDLFREGLILNLVAVVVTTLLCLLLGPLVLPG